MIRSPPAFFHRSRSCGGPLATPTMFRRFRISIVCCMTSSSVAGPQIGSEHGGFFNQAPNTAAQG